MAWYDIFNREKSSTASVAKDRLQIIIARERGGRRGEGPDYLPRLQQELLAVIARYEHVDLDQVSVNVDRRGEGEVLELNIVLPDTAPAAPRRSVRAAIA